MAAERACIMVWDGLRPDRVSQEITPNLWRLAEAGVWFERSHAVYPTLTRANSTSNLDRLPPWSSRRAGE